MINLLPPDLKQGYRYARYNRMLARWLATFTLALLGVVVITSIGLLIMGNSIDSYKSHIAVNTSQLASENFNGTEAQVATISNNLKLMLTVLSKEILFSKLLARLGSLTPPSVTLTGLSISQTQSAIDITAQSTNYKAATQLQANLAAPNNQVFSGADLVSISCANGTIATNPAYPCTASIRAQFTNNNPFLFINAPVQKAGSR